MFFPGNITSIPIPTHTPDMVYNAESGWVDVTSSGIFLSLLALASVALSQPACVPAYIGRQNPGRAFRLSPLLCGLDIFHLLRVLLLYIRGGNTIIGSIRGIAQHRFPVETENPAVIELEGLGIRDSNSDEGTGSDEDEDELTARNEQILAVLSIEHIRALQKESPVRRLVSLAALLPYIKLCATKNLLFEQIIATVYTLEILINEYLVWVRTRPSFSSSPPSTTADVPATYPRPIGKFWRFLTVLLHILHFRPAFAWYWRKILPAVLKIMPSENLEAPGWFSCSAADAKEIYLVCRNLGLNILVVFLYAPIAAVIRYLLLFYRLYVIVFATAGFWCVGIVGAASVVHLTNPMSGRLWKRPVWVLTSMRLAAGYTLATAVVYYYGYFEVKGRKQTWWAGEKIG